MIFSNSGIWNYDSTIFWDIENIIFFLYIHVYDVSSTSISISFLFFFFFLLFFFGGGCGVEVLNLL